MKKKASKPISLDERKVFDFKATVTKVRPEGTKKVVTLDTGHSLELSRYGCVGINDLLHLRKRNGVVAIDALCSIGRATILPAFRFTRPLSGVTGRLIVREARTTEDLEALETLTRYHYRADNSFGRRTILVAILENATESSFAGYIEITNTFSGHQARNKLLDAQFRDGSGIRWDRWDVKARGKYLNTIARISRCVVHPEFRGIGLGVALCTAAQTFARDYWHIARQKSIFLEITADMLKFVPFAESAGMKFIGTTSGNIERLKKDQSYLSGVLEQIERGERDRESHSVFSAKAKSILTKQRSDLDRLRKIASDQNLDVPKMLDLFLSARTPEGMSTKAYNLLQSLLRFPKPTYMCGLTADASAFLSARLSKEPPKEASATPKILSPLSAAHPVQISDLTISYKQVLPSTGWANAVREAFGIDTAAVTGTGISKLDLEIREREILYVWGPSGSGKTGFLDVLCGLRKPTSGHIKSWPRDKIAIFNTDFDERPLVELLELQDLQSALYCLNLAGLSEASLYFKTPSMLSAGQRHRLGLAKIIASRRPVWIVDEFCSVLDDMTAAIVAKNFAKVARRLGVTAVIAGPRREPVVPALTPDRILLLTSLARWQLREIAQPRRTRGI